MVVNFNMVTDLLTQARLLLIAAPGAPTIADRQAGCRGSPACRAIAYLGRQDVK
jgi:hypothetical protein